MPRLIVTGVNYNGEVYLPGDERKLAEAGLTSAQYKRLEDMNVIAGFSRRHIDPGEYGEDEEVSPLDLSIHDLPGVVQKIESIETLEELLEKDGRKSAQKLYAKQIDKLERRAELEAAEQAAHDAREAERAAGPVVIPKGLSQLPGVLTTED